MQGRCTVVHLPCFWQNAPLYQAENISIPGWQQGDTRVISGVHLSAPAFHLKNFPIRYQGDTRVIPGDHLQFTCVCAPPITSLYHNGTRVIPEWYQGDTRYSPRCTCLASEKFPLHINTCSRVIPGCTRVIPGVCLGAPTLHLKKISFHVNTAVLTILVTSD